MSLFGRVCLLDIDIRACACECMLAFVRMNIWKRSWICLYVWFAWKVILRYAVAVAYLSLRPVFFFRFGCVRLLI